MLAQCSRTARHFLLALASALPLISFAGVVQAASFDFVSSGGQFTIAAGSLSFGNGLTISSATTDLGDPDTSLVNAAVLLDSIVLSGSNIALPGGLTAIGIDNSIDYEMRIFERAVDGGALIASATYDPGDFVVIGASGLVSAEIIDGVSNIVVAQPAFSTTLDELDATGFAIDFNVTLSAAGQNMAARISSGDLIAGAVAGSVATVIPEPGTNLLMVLGLMGLSFVQPAPRH